MSKNGDNRTLAIEGAPNLEAIGPVTIGLVLLLSLFFIILVALFWLGEGYHMLKQMNATMVCIFIAQEFLPPPSAEYGARLRKKVVLSRATPIPCYQTRVL